MGPKIDDILKFIQKGYKEWKAYKYACYEFSFLCMESTKRLTFSVTRKSPELLCPAKSTPHELKILSDIDGQIFIRKYIKIINFYKKSPSMKGKDPVKIIREAISKALVFYYPLAGRLLENIGR